jgi:uncharacterized RDD family membrane protein YckC
VEENKCEQCGTPASPRAKYCESCGAPLPTEEQQQPVTAPSEAQTGVAALPYQSVGIRFVATIIDLIVAGIIAGFVVLPLRSPSQINVMNTTGLPMVSVTQNPFAGLGSVITVIIIFVYFWLLEGAYGQTVGKMAVKIKVLREDGSKIDYADSAARNILRPIDLIPYVIPYLLGAILIWSSDKKQRLGDRVAHTVVVKA